MKASTIKRRRDTTYTSTMITTTATPKKPESNNSTEITNMIGNRDAIPVRTAEETRHSIASALEGKSKNHPMQCIPPKTPPTTGIQKEIATLHPIPISLSSGSVPWWLGVQCFYTHFKCLPGCDDDSIYGRGRSHILGHSLIHTQFQGHLHRVNGIPWGLCTVNIGMEMHAPIFELWINLWTMENDIISCKLV